MKAQTCVIYVKLALDSFNLVRQDRVRRSEIAYKEDNLQLSVQLLVRLLVKMYLKSTLRNLELQLV